MATPAGRHAAFSRQVLAAAVAVCFVVFGIAASPATAAPQQTGSTSALDGVTFTSVGNGRGLDVQNGGSGTGSIIVTDSAPGYDESWHIGTGASNSSFTIVNDATGQCVDAGLPLRQQPCDGRASEKWYFQPVAGSGQAFMIRHEGDGNCLDVWYNAQYDDAWTDSYGCNGSTAQQWTLPATAYETAWNMAVDHAAAQCQSDTSTCSWTAASQAPAEPLPQVCVSPVWYNGSSTAVPWKFTINNTTGWTSKIGFSFSADLTAGTAQALQTKVSSTVSGEVTLNISQTLGNELTITVPTAQYAWVALSELATQVTGTWTFDATGFAWTAGDTVTVPLTNDDTGGASIYLAKTSSTFTSCAT